MASMHKRVGFLVSTRMREMVRDGRGDELRGQLARLVGESEARVWMERLEGDLRGR